MKDIILSTTSSADLTDKEGLGVMATGTGAIELANATNDEIAGVIVQGATAGNQVAVALPGSIVNVRLSGTVKAMDPGKIAADATFLKSALATGDVVCVRFLEAGISGDLVQALILPAILHA